jgi:hypothetical protein
MIDESYDFVEVLGEDPLVTFDEFKSQCYKDCADASFEEVKSQWDDMLEEQHKDARKRVKDKDGQFMLALVGQGKKVMRDVVGSGTRTCDVDRQSFQDDPVIQMLGGGSNATGQTCSRTRLSALFNPSTKRLPSRAPSPARSSVRSRHDRGPSPDHEVGPEDSVSQLGDSSPRQPPAKKTKKVVEPFGAAIAAAEGKVLNSVEFLQAKVGHV